MSTRVSARTDKSLDRVRDVLQKALASDTIIDVFPSGVRKNLHVLVISRALDEMSEYQKQEYVWDILERAVKSKKLTSREVDRISVILTFSVDELRR